MFEFGAIIFTFRDTLSGTSVLYACSNHNNDLKNKQTAPGNNSADNGGLETKMIWPYNQRPTLIMIVAWELIIGVLLLMQNLR
jgi:hypothetical protein